MKLYVNDVVLEVTNAPQSRAGFWRIRIDLEDAARITFPVTGTVKLKANSGFVLASAKASDYQYSYMDGSYLTLSNTAPPEPEPEPEPDPEPEGDVWDDLANAIREGVNDVD